MFFAWILFRAFFSYYFFFAMYNVCNGFLWYDYFLFVCFYFCVAWNSIVPASVVEENIKKENIKTKILYMAFDYLTIKWGLSSAFYPICFTFALSWQLKKQPKTKVRCNRDWFRHCSDEIGRSNALDKICEQCHGNPFFFLGKRSGA